MMDAFLHIPVQDAVRSLRIPVRTIQGIILDRCSAEAVDALTAEQLGMRLAAWRQGAVSFPPVYVRVSPVEHPLHFADLCFATESGADGIVLSGCRSGMDVTCVAARLNVTEVEHGKMTNGLCVLAEVAAVPLSGQGNADYAGRSARLKGLVVAAPEACIGAQPHAEAGSAWMLMRMLTLLAGRAAHLPVIDAVSIGDGVRFQGLCQQAHADGFAGKAVHTVNDAKLLHEAMHVSAALSA